MNRVRGLLLTLAMISLFQLPAIAQREMGIQEGDSSLAVYFQLKNMAPEKGVDTIMKDIFFTYGYFFSQSLEAGIGLINQGLTMGGYSNVSIFFFPFMKYHFIHENPKFTPYLGLSIFMGRGVNKSPSYDFTSPTFGLEFQGGIDIFVTENAAIGFELAFGNAVVTVNTAYGGYDFGQTQTTFRIPLRVYW